ncbi:MAG: CapA family protein [Acutalibacteraceae bacterium]
MQTNKKHDKNKNRIIIFAVIFFVCLASIAVVSAVSMTGKTNLSVIAGTNAYTEAPTEPPAPQKLSTATIGSAGDVLIHVPIYTAAYSSSTGTYDFNDAFSVVKTEIKKCDYFVANLETTLAGTANGRSYSGYPCFNSPDAIATALKSAGVDCLLTANNHCYDTGKNGVLRTQQIVKEANLSYVGTRTETTSNKYIVKNIKDIKFGMTCYTYETETTQENTKALNGILVDSETADLINSFDYNKLDSFYSDIKSQISKMKSAGAEVIVVYLHWGNEYELKQNSFQEKIAQKLCDLGVDVIIGGHPHVVQPVDLLTSTDGSHKTVCVYSMGNMVSNQRRNYMSLNTGHTEDGLIFEMTFSKYSDGTVRFDKVKAVPTWVNLYTNSSGKSVYSITPLSSDLESKAQSLGLSNSSVGLSLAKGSYERTLALVSEGINKCNKYLKSQPIPGQETSEATTAGVTDVSQAA